MIQIVPSLQETELRTSLQAEQPKKAKSTQFMQDFALLLAALFGDEAPKESTTMPAKNAISRNVTQLPDIMIASDEKESMVEEPTTGQKKDSLSQLELEEKVDLDEPEEIEEIIEPHEKEPDLLDKEPVVSAQVLSAQIQQQPLFFDTEHQTKGEPPIQTLTTHPLHHNTGELTAVPQIERTLEIKEEAPAQGLSFIVHDAFDADGLTLEEKPDLKLFHPTENSMTEGSMKEVWVNRSNPLQVGDTQAKQSLLPKMQNQALNNESLSVNMMEAADESQPVTNVTESIVNQPFEPSLLETIESLELRADPGQAVPFITAANGESQVEPSSSLLPDREEVNIRDGTVTVVEPELGPVEEQAVTAEPPLEESDADHLETDTAQKPDKNDEVQEETKPQQTKPEEVEVKSKEFKPSEVSVSFDSPSVQNSSEKIVESPPNGDQTFLSREAVLDLQETQRIVPKLTERLQTLISEERSEVRIQLKPESLGELKIKVALEQGVISAEFMVESETVREIVAAHLPQLRSTLQDMGTNVSQLVVNIDTGQKDSQDDPTHRLWEKRAFNTRRGSRSIGTAAKAATVFTRSNRSWNQVDLKA